MNPIYKTIIIGSTFLVSGLTGLEKIHTNHPKNIQNQTAISVSSNQGLEQTLTQLKNKNKQLQNAVSNAKQQEIKAQVNLKSLQKQAVSLQQQEQQQEEAALRQKQTESRPAVQAVSRASGSREHDEGEHGDDD